MNKQNKYKNKLKKTLSLSLLFFLLSGVGAAPITASTGSLSQGLSAQPEALTQVSSRMSAPVKGSSYSQVNSSLTDAEGKAQGPTGRLVVKLSPSTSPELIAEKVQAKIARKGPLQFVTLALEPSRLNEVMTELRTLSGVLSVSPSQEVKVADTGGTVANAATSSITDSHYAEQWGLTKIEAQKAWALGATGQGITVAIVDTGVDLSHPDLKNNLVPGYNAITGQEGPFAAQDNNGHGTHVAGIIAAGLNGVGVVGVAYQAKIMPIKAMNRTGEGTDDVIADGIVWAVDHGAQIINLSLGADTQEEVLKEAVQYAIDQGALVVAAAGNKEDGTNYSTITYPASDPDVLAVTATDVNDRLASFSLTGPQANLAAPGTNILSDYWQNASGYATSDGTSMSSPFVAGAAALVWSMHPDFAASQIRQVLEDSAIDLGTPGRDSSYGYGRVDAYWALKFAEKPTVLNSPGSVSWSGAVVQGETPNTVASVAVPGRAFSLDPTKNVSLALGLATGANELPSGILPMGDPVLLDWGQGMTVEKMITLTLTAKADNLPSDSNRILSIYRWSGSRWLRVGGGVRSGAVTAGITEPGIYQIGATLLPEGNRLAGTDRLQTALQISQAAFPTGADTVILARSDDFPDALSGASLAYRYHAPILLTDVTELSTDVLAEINRLKPKTIILLGGTGAISPSIEIELKSVASVRRLGGVNRFDTAAQIAAHLGFIGEATVVNGNNYPDAISMASIAAQKGIPILLTEKTSLPSETTRALNQLHVSQTVVVGGEGVISATQFTNFPNPNRLFGQDRYGTAAALLQAFPPQGTTAFLATGENFPDALTGGVLAALNGTNLVLVSPSGPNPQEQALLQTWQGQMIYALGGSGVVSEGVLQGVQGLVKK